MPKIALETVEQTNRTGYPPPLDQPVAGRFYRRLAPAVGITDFGASDVTLEPGAWSSQRHWHEGEDELVVMLGAGDIASFPKGVAKGHHLINRSNAPCRFVAIGRPAASDCHYPDVDLHLDGATNRYLHKDGTPY